MHAKKQHHVNALPTIIKIIADVRQDTSTAIIKNIRSR